MAPGGFQPCGWDRSVPRKAPGGRSLALAAGGPGVGSERSQPVRVPGN